jgi:N-methylhydantoinase A
VAFGRNDLTPEPLAAAFHERHRRRYTFALEDTPVEIVNFRTITMVEMARPKAGAGTREDSDGSEACKGRRGVDPGVVAIEGGSGWGDVPIYERDRLGVDFVADGPLIVEEPSATTLVHRGQRLAVDRFRNLVIHGQRP